ncbi:hypothetical protein BDF20DRAFT_203466 [Mycotypha africana]|uniref:uncharacterized protein n=1 Tax=Mycotypha africana TaxID=64632 RepID=UPI0023000952|nr:uncharacterized protein BDF20DRAFT_203466 [Mycotypha africana]KAI8968020.1 hypothetical protein BDF20DRAFT_203466 [Mycotypha africana]
MALGEDTIATNYANVQSYIGFWLFVLYCLVVIVVAIFFLFYFNRVVGQLLTFLINQFTWRRYNAYIEVDSIRVSLLGGRILFKNLRYLSTNASISILKGHVTIRYWLFNVRSTKNDKYGKLSNLPCRIVCSVEGFEWFLYNNTAAYNKIRDILGLSSTDMDRANSTLYEHKTLGRAHSVNQLPLPSTDEEPSLLEKLMPLQFQCTTGAIMIGNTDLKSMLVLKLSQASGIYTKAKSRSPMDYYKTVADCILRKVQISMKNNMDFTNVEPPSQVSSEPLPRAAFFFWLLKPLKCFLPFASMRQYGKMQHMHNIMGQDRQHKEMNEENTTYHEEYARVSNIVDCNEMALTYYADYAGPVPSTEASDQFYNKSVDIGNGGLPPEWGIRISLWDAVIHYGPWADRQRSQMQDYFFPSSHRNNIPTTKLIPGQQRIATAFETYIEFMNDMKLLIPTREKSKDWKYTLGSMGLDVDTDGHYTRPYGWINIKAGEGSYVRINTPFVIGRAGHTSTIDIVLKNTEINSSVNHASFIQTEKVEISCIMPTPLQWNGFRQWNFKLNVRKPIIFLLRDHIYLLQDLVKDWTASSAPADLLYFTPMTYVLQFNLDNPTIILCVNDHNVINNPNSVADNAFFKLQGHQLTASITLPFVTYQPETTSVKFAVNIEHGSAGLSLQTSHTLNAFLREEDSHAAVAVSLSIDGTYDFYNSVDIVRHVETCNLHIKISGATVKLFGTLIRYIFILKANYFGEYNHFSTLDEYRRRKANKEEWLEQKAKQAAAKPLSDPFEVYLLLELDDGVLLLPENLYECSRYSQLEFQELQLELRNLDVYLDMYLNISPITISRDSNPTSQSTEGLFRIKNARDPKNYVYVDGLNVSAHRLFGPLPQCLTYLCHWEFDIGRITGEIKPSFLLGLGSFGQSFAYNMIDEDNAAPQELESKNLPDVTFLKLFVQEVDVCLMSMNSATNIKLAEGILLEFDNLINIKYSQRISLKIPQVLVRSLANPDQARGDTDMDEENYSWVEVAKADLGLNVTIFRQTASWRILREKQQEFIRAQDYPTRRCSKLYENAETPKSSVQHSDNHHVGVLYAPPFRPFTFGHVNDTSKLYSSQLSTSAEQLIYYEDFRSYGDDESISSYDATSGSSYVSDYSEQEDESYVHDEIYEALSMKSGTIKDVESFHTADNTDYDNYSYVDDFSTTSKENSDEQSSSYNTSYNGQTDTAIDKQHQLNEKNLVAAIPPSIPYSDYLRRYKVKRYGSEIDYGSFFHSFMPPSKPHFIPEKECENKDTPIHNFVKQNSTDYFGNDDDNGISENTGTDGQGNEVLATIVIEATKAVTILVTPILVKVVQELAEEIIKDDWDLETMLDTLQMKYIEQLTRYLTDQYICTRFAVILPQTYLQFIQNATMPNDLPSYKHGESVVKTQYNSEGTVLCSADFSLNDLKLMGRVRFEDYAFNEKKNKMVESKLVLQESRVHFDLDSIGSTVRYISRQREQHPIDFGIPYERLRNKKRYADSENDNTLIDELVMLDLSVKEFNVKWLGAMIPNYVSLNFTDVDTIIITESVEILMGAVYSWLVFVDDLKGILEGFREQRTRQMQVFINAIANFSITRGVVGDPAFLTTPTTMLRLGSRNFRNDCGWKLLARMRHCLRSMPLSTREALQYRLTSGHALQELDSEAMFDNVVNTFSLWRSWEISSVDIQNCRLFTQPFKQTTRRTSSIDIENTTDRVIRFLVSSTNLAKLSLKNFKFAIFEEEAAHLNKEDNSISIENVNFAFEALYKSTLVSPVVEPTTHGHSKPFIVPEGYLDIVTNLNIGGIDITTNPIVLAFARHMLLVQRVFAAKLSNLSHTKKLTSKAEELSYADFSQAASIADNQTQFNFDSFLSKIDIVVHALLNVDGVQLMADARELCMESNVKGVCGSIMLSNPKLSPLHIINIERESDTGSGKRSSNRASKRNGNLEPRLLLEATGGINMVDIKFKEEIPQKQRTAVLLGVLIKKANVNANITQVPKISKKHSSKSESSKNILNVFSNIQKFHIDAPQSLLRLYGFIESWQAEQGRRYHFMFQNLVKEWEEQRKELMSISKDHAKNQILSTSLSETTTRKPFITDVKLQFLLNEFVAKADLLPSLSANYRIVNFFIMVDQLQHKSEPAFTYAFQLSKQVIQLVTKDTRKAKSTPIVDNASIFSIPGIRSTGSIRKEIVDGVAQTKLQAIITIDIISLSLNVGLIDSLLTAQSLVGNELSELVEVLSYSKRNSTLSASTDTGSAIKADKSKYFLYAIELSLDGLRISASSPGAIGVFQSNLLEATLCNEITEKTVSDSNTKLYWKLQAKHFSLSLDHDFNEETSSGWNTTTENNIYKRDCLAYITLDFTLQNYLPKCNIDNCQKDTHAHDREGDFESIFVDLSRVRTVMQPIALGKLADMYIYYDSELKKKKLKKKDEIDQLSANTKRIVQSFSTKDDWPKTFQNEPQTLLRDKLISIRVQQLGIAIPLTVQADASLLESNRNGSALLLSISSIEFTTKNIEKNALELENISVQFVRRFDQNKADHFIAEKHPQMNQIQFPFISCRVATALENVKRSVDIDAHVKGFAVAMDGSIADYINTLNVIYHKSMDRFDAFTTKAFHETQCERHTSSSSMEAESDNTSAAPELVYLDIGCKFECESGVIRLYPKRFTSDIPKSRKKPRTLRINTSFDFKSVEGNMATIELPSLSTLVNYETPLGSLSKNTPKRLYADILIQESTNTLHPALAQFLRDVTAGLKTGIQQKNERRAAKNNKKEIYTNLDATVLLRLSRTQVELSCQPNSKVSCSFGWEDSEFLFNAFSSGKHSRTISCLSSFQEIKGIVKHHFSPEPCLVVGLNRIILNAILSSHQSDNKDVNEVSVIVKLPLISGKLNMRHLQDLLILQTCWLGDEKPFDPADIAKVSQNKQQHVEGESTLVNAEENINVDDGTIAHVTLSSSKHLAIHIQNMQFSADLGQNIGEITLMPEELSVLLHNTPAQTKGLDVSLDSIKVIADGRLSGKAHFKKALIRGFIDKTTKQSTVYIHSAGFTAGFAYEYQNILDAIQQPLEIDISLLKLNDRYELNVDATLEALMIRISVKTVPVIITMVRKFKELLQKKKIEAGISSETYHSALNTQKGAITLETLPKKKKKNADHKTTAIQSLISVAVRAVEVLIYPSQFQDTDNVDMRAKQFQLIFKGLANNEEAEHRVLTIKLLSAALAKNVPGKDLMVYYSDLLHIAEGRPKHSGGTKIFGIPDTEIKMKSIQLETDITYSFDAVFGGRISVSLNIGLIRYLQEMINIFNMQLDRALKRNSGRYYINVEASTPMSTNSNGDMEELEGKEESIELSQVEDINPADKSSALLKPLQTQGEEKQEDITVNDRYTYTALNSVNFQPQLQIMGEATPPVEWLGLKRERIPGLIHENITLHLDKLSRIIWEHLNSQMDQ